MSQPPSQLRIAVFVCRCGINIAGVLNTKALAEFAKTLPNVIYADDNISLCTTSGAEVIKTAISQEHADRIIIAA